MSKKLDKLANFQQKSRQIGKFCQPDICTFPAIFYIFRMYACILYSMYIKKTGIFSYLGGGEFQDGRCGLVSR